MVIHVVHPQQVVALASLFPAEPACTMWLVRILHTVQCVCPDHTTVSNTIVAALGSQRPDRRKVRHSLHTKTC